MKIRIKINFDQVLKEIYLRAYFLIKENKGTRASQLAILGLGGGFISPFIGGLLDLVAWFTATGVTHYSLYGTSMIFYVITLPLLALGSHSLDLLEKKSSIPSAEKLKADKLDLGLNA